MITPANPWAFPVKKRHHLRTVARAGKSLWCRLENSKCSRAHFGTLFACSGVLSRSETTKTNQSESKAGDQLPGTKV